MLLPTDCSELDCFREDELSEDTDSKFMTFHRTSGRVAEPEIGCTEDMVHILKLILCRHNVFDSITMEVEGNTVTLRECLDKLEVLLVYPPNTCLHSLISTHELRKNDARIQQEFAPLVIVTGLREDVDSKLDFINKQIQKNNPLVELQVDAWPFGAKFEKVLAKMLRDNYMRRIEAALRAFTGSLEHLLVVEDVRAHMHQPTCQLQRDLQVLEQLAVGEEYQNYYNTFLRVGKALYHTKMAILDGEKQKRLNLFVHVLEAMRREIKVTVDETDFQRNFSNLLTQVRTSAQLLKDNKSCAEMYADIMYVLDVLDYERFLQGWRELHMIQDLLKFLVGAQVPFTNARATWRATLKQYIVSPLAEVYGALRDLSLTLPRNKPLSLEQVLENLMARVREHTAVKARTEPRPRPGCVVPIYPPPPSGSCGICVIINNINFKADGRTRLGAVIDEANLEDIFSQVGFHIMKYRDVKQQDELFSILDDVKRYVFSSVVVVVMSHGGQKPDAAESSLIQLIDEDVVSVEEVVGRFTYEAAGCKAVPKMFLFQVCRGGRSNPTMSRPDEDVTVFSSARRVPNISDSLLAFGTAPGYISKRFPYRGTLFISEFCDVFRKRAHDTHLEDMLIIVNDNIKGRRALDDPMQTCCFENRGFKHFYFTTN